MKYALISDVHSNLPALEAVLAAIDGREDVGAVYHLGDLVRSLARRGRRSHARAPHTGGSRQLRFDGRNRLQALRLQG